MTTQLNDSPKAHEFKPGVTVDALDTFIVAAKAFFNLHRNHFYGSASDFKIHNDFHKALQTITGKKVV